jgi:hypothetical protein
LYLPVHKCLLSVHIRFSCFPLSVLELAQLQTAFSLGCAFSATTLSHQICFTHLFSLKIDNIPPLLKNIFPPLPLFPLPC